MTVSIRQQLEESVAVLNAMAEQADLIEQIAAHVRDTVLGGNLLLTCGNGGSATDAQHLAEELIGRFRSNRRSLPAVALTADSSAITCIANDFGYDFVFSRQIEGLAKPGDVMLCFSTSGNSANIVEAIKAAKAKGASTIALLGKDGGAAREIADYALVVRSNDTARIQEAHLQVLHYICEVIEYAVVVEQK